MADTFTVPTSVTTASNAPSDTAARILLGLAALFCDIEEAARALREQVDAADPCALNCITVEVLRGLCLRCDIGRRLAQNSQDLHATTEEHMLRASTAALLGL